MSSQLKPRTRFPQLAPAVISGRGSLTSVRPARSLALKAVRQAIAGRQIGEVPMNSAEFKDFSQLYRAAYAEADQERKTLLLREVRKAIDERVREMREEISEPAQAA